jgi:TorA maturation chaperone TorD
MTVRDVIDEFSIVMRQWSTELAGEVQPEDVSLLLRRLEQLTTATLELETHERRIAQLVQLRTGLIGPTRAER